PETEQARQRRVVHAALADAFDHAVGRLAQDEGDREHRSGAEHGEQDDPEYPRAVGAQHAQDPPGGAAEVRGPGLRRVAARPHHAHIASWRDIWESTISA